MSQTITVVANPGTTSSVQLPSTGKVAVCDLANGTPFDLTYQGFGCPGSMTIEAGLKVRLYHEVLDTGQMSILPVNNVGVTGTGIINITVYFINETVPPGTFPVAIPTQIVSAKVSTVTDLINDGNPSGHQFEESTVSGAPGSTWSFTNDGNNSFIAVLISNVVHKLIQIFNSGNELRLGEAGNATEILGQLIIDQVLTSAGNHIAAGGMNINTIRDNVTGVDQIDLATAGVTINNKVTLSGAVAADAAGPINFTSGGTSNAITRGGSEIIAYNAVNGDTEIKGTASGGRVLLSTSDGFTAQVQAGASGGIAINTANTHGYQWFNGGFIPEISVFTGAATGTYNHGFNGAGESLTPFDIIPMCNISGSQTMGFDSTTTTQVHITSGAGLSFKAFCL